MIDDDEIFTALANVHRRRLLVELLHSDPQQISALSERSLKLVDATERLLREYLSSSRTISGVNERLLRLHYVHLPMLAAYGFVEWDRNANVARKGPRFDEIRPLLELIDDRRVTLPAEDPIVSLRR